MTKHKKAHGHNPKNAQPKQKKGVHTDWRAWTVVILMIGAILGYVLTDNETLAGWFGGGNVQPAVSEDVAAE